MSSPEEYRALAERLAAKAALCEPKEFNVSFDEDVELGLLCDRHRQHSWPCPESALLREAVAALKALRERLADENALVIRVERVRTHLMDVMNAARTVDPKMHMILWAINDELRAALPVPAAPVDEAEVVKAALLEQERTESRCGHKRHHDHDTVRYAGGHYQPANHSTCKPCPEPVHVGNANV